MAENSYDLVVLGSGTGGYSAAIRAAGLGLKVAVVEKEDRCGGTCLNWGCIPTKALLHAAEVMDGVHEASERWGIKATVESIDYSATVANREDIVTKNVKGLEGHLKKDGIAIVRGRGRVTGPRTVQVEGTGELTASRALVLATGSQPRSIPGPGDRRRAGDQLRPRPEARLPAQVGDRARRRGGRGRVRLVLAVHGGRGDHRRGPARPGPAGGRRQPARAGPGVQEARHHLDGRDQAGGHQGHRRAGHGDGDRRQGQDLGGVGRAAAGRHRPRPGHQRPRLRGHRGQAGPRLRGPQELGHPGDRRRGRVRGRRPAAAAGAGPGPRLLRRGLPDRRDGRRPAARRRSTTPASPGSPSPPPRWRRSA